MATILNPDGNTDPTVPASNNKHSAPRQLLAHSKKVQPLTMAKYNADSAPDFTHCEFYSTVGEHAIRLHGEWMPQAGFTEGTPFKIRVMKDCIVITAQNTNELWGCIEGMSVTGVNKQKVQAWLKTFPGALHDVGDIPAIKRGR
ncbi:SymE family type I addiction module toxin [Kluyvera intermedia]|jgi:toxic protein SymE|uniref:SymE family type I addiction module toxin n=1 Tax=Kluyvera intermedia TaxID=61648 RepID=UPI0024320764|nr:SymE family type I addiction module toxin [Kluyvera intermedia]WEJ85421.1 MAG: SymE family type I addiction module toxin [Kluyvera intermedia]